MRILLTNDDGIDSRGLILLHQRLRAEHEVWLIAPEHEMSGSSHSVSLKSPIRVRRRGEREFAANGTPVDCVLLAFLALVPGQIDMVVSGINHGPNLGTDILYSGTVAAARQGALFGRPACAVSLSGVNGDFMFEQPVEFVARNLKLLLDEWSEDHFVNINFPPQGGFPFIPRITFPSRRIYRDNFARFNAPDGSMYCFLQGEDPYSHKEEGSDFDAISAGAVSISPVLIHPANHEIEVKYQNLDFWKGESVQV
jgi:5'-nucleotidase